MRVNSSDSIDRNGLNRGHRVNAAALVDSLPLLAQSAPHSTDGLRNLRELLSYVLEGVEAEIDRREDDEQDPWAIARREESQTCNCSNPYCQV